MLWKELIVKTNTAGSELVADVLYTAGSEGVSIIDTEDLTDVLKSDIIWDYVEEHLLERTEEVLVKGYYKFENFEAIYHTIFEQINLLKGSFGSLEILVSEVDDTEWLENWKKFYQPMQIGNFVVVPQWINYPPKNKDIIVKINPGMAFGTGSHESTRMCLQIIDSIDMHGKFVIDVGTGSGILGIASLKAGAKACNMYDIDEEAIKSAKQNAQLNGITNAVIEQANLLDKANLVADVIIANITADILIALSNNLYKFLKVGGDMILSGIIKAYKQQVKTAYEQRGFVLKKEINEGEWCALHLIYNGN
ncbi:MAG: 50S ribosomal protein L11 methyltransferase [Clostridia bacterium]